MLMGSYLDSPNNLGALCKLHHQHKTHAGWTITASSADGSCAWRSPLGRTYEHETPAVLPWTSNDLQPGAHPFGEQRSEPPAGPRGRDNDPNF